MRMITIAKFPSVDDALLARMKLEGSGVEAFVPDELTASTNWFYTNAIGGIRLQVREEDRERALEVLELNPSEEGILKCPNCGSQKVSHRRMSAFSALSFALGVFIPFGTTKIDCLECRTVFRFTKKSADKQV